MSTRVEIKLYLLAILLVIIGGLNWGAMGVFGRNLIEEFNQWIFKSEWFSRSIYIIIALAALYLLIKKHSFLPFKGPMTMSTSNLQYDHSYSEFSVRVEAPNAAGVVYWATNLRRPATDPIDAYDEYLNSGYVPVDSDGKATLYFKCPVIYKAWGGGDHKKHLHYRLVYAHGENGGLNISEIRTVNVKCSTHTN